MSFLKNRKFISNFNSLKAYCESESFKDWNPYDGINSKFFKALHLDKVLENMQDKKGDYFYYQINRAVSSKIPYMRWGQAWMFYAFSFYAIGNHHDK